MRIAIVDDITSEQEALKAGLETQLSRLCLDAACFCFGSGADFLSAAAGMMKSDAIPLGIVYQLKVTILHRPQSPFRLII